MHTKPTWGSRLFDAANTLFLIACSLITLFPFLYILATSLAPLQQVLRGGVILWPETFTWDAYRTIFSNTHFVRSLYTTFFITVVGTFTNLLLTTFMAYPLAKKRLKGRGVILFLVVFSILFNGGLIPSYMIVKSLGLINTVWSLIIPGAISAFNLIIMKNFFQAIPEELEEAARIDGCKNWGVLFRIVLPLSMPALATFTLFYAVGHWNQFFAAVMYVTKPNLWPIQVVLRQMIIEGSTQDFEVAMGELKIIPTTIKMAAIIVATVPILFVYPFLQKHFAKGVLLGSVKG
ncbi:carbohydrate ABC transporter permease [Paenibacillus doosanensis]|uniref:L-arabinose transport system permease protein AraQ n=1 Tax=Paenibacillus konkukensis TaxID=2020716 RepID=A0ABY4RX62_9BACL|nr:MULTISPECIES: carbohydrate ABC transporter permease [Paenibacillus]MCS7458669.1 carbohydrate ABC transporter permease [Paenibacillus doosanensis]UQZ86808.1 L-arabinose transport system permease protein AraQ [Paenibacillus konkukensis]